MVSSVDPTTIGAFASIVIAFLTVAKIMLKQASKDREADRAERIQRDKDFKEVIESLSGSMEKMADPEVNGNKAIADGITRQADESAERNGHLGELILEQGKQGEKIANIAVNKIIDSVQHVGTQKVDNQVIEHKE